MIPRLPDAKPAPTDLGPAGGLGPSGPMPEPVVQPASVVPRPEPTIPATPAIKPQPVPEYGPEIARQVADDDIGRTYEVAQAARTDSDAMRWMMERAQQTGAVPPPEPVRPRDGVDAMAQYRAERAGQANNVVKGVFALPQILNTATPVLSDVATGLTSDAGNVWLGGPLLAIRNSLDLIDHAATWLNENVLDTRFDQSTPPKAGEAIISGNIVPNVGGVMDKPKSVTGNIMQAMTQFITGFATGGRLMGMSQATTAAGAMGQTLMKGAFADFAAFKGADANLATLVQMVPELRNPVTAYLAHEGDDGELEQRMQNVIAGAVPNVVFEGFLAGLRGFREYRRVHSLVANPGDQADDVARKIARVVENEPNPAAGAPDNLGQRVEDLLGRRAGPDIEVREKWTPARVMDDAAANNAKITDTGIGEAETARQMVGAAEAKPKPPPVPGSPERPVASEVYVNWSRIDGPDDIKRMMAQMVDAQPEDIAKAQRGVRSNQMTAAAADEQDAWKLLVGERKAGAAKAMTAEEQFALRRLWTSAGDKLMELARAAREGGPEELYAFRRMMATYDLIQKEVIGVRTETARALQQWAMPAGSNTKMLEDLNNALIRSGGMDFNKELAERIVMAGELGGPKAIGEFIEKSWRAKSADALREIWINSILSGPKTHLVNIISNSAVLAHSMTERAIAGRLGGILSPVDGVRVGEATAMMQGLRQSYKDAFRLAAKAWRTGQSGFGMQQIDAPRLNTISAEGMSVSADSAMGKALDALGAVINTPGRALGAADEFFKTINYRAELWAQAYRTASEEIDRGVLAASKLKERMADIIRNPPDEIATKARELAKYNTFTNDPGEFSRAVMKIRSIVDRKSTDAFGVPSASFVIPFLNTPANIFSYAFERTPVAAVMGRFKADIAAGGARANLAMTKLGLGTMMMTVAYDMAMDGAITGAGPTGQKNSSKRAHMRQGGWQPYSVRVQTGTKPDGTPEYRWFAYNRFDPLGTIVGLAADIADYTRNHNDGVDIEAMEAFAAAIFATAENLTGKAYLRGFSDFVEAMNDYQYKSEYFANRLLSSFVPTGVKEVAQFMDPRAKQATDIVDSIKARLPGYSDEVPARLNYWGEPIQYTSGLGSTYDALSPIYSSSNAKATPVDREFFRINYFPRHPGTVRVDGRQVTLRNMPEARNRLVELTAATKASDLVNENLADLVQARGGKAAMSKLQRLGDRTLKEALTDMVEGRLGRYSIDYQQADDNDKWREMSQMISLYRKAANLQVLREFPRIKEIRGKMPERAETADEAPF